MWWPFLWVPCHVRDNRDNETTDSLRPLTVKNPRGRPPIGGTYYKFLTTADFPTLFEVNR